MQTNVLNLSEQCAMIVDEIRSNFDFGTEVLVESMDGWASEEPGDIMTSKVYVKTSDEQEDSIKLTLTVVFENNDSSKVIEVYAIDSGGNIWS